MDQYGGRGITSDGNVPGSAAATTAATTAATVARARDRGLRRGRRRLRGRGEGRLESGMVLYVGTPLCCPRRDRGGGEGGHAFDLPDAGIGILRIADADITCGADIGEGVVGDRGHRPPYTSRAQRPSPAPARRSSSRGIGDLSPTDPGNEISGGPAHFVVASPPYHPFHVRSPVVALTSPPAPRLV